MALVVRIDQPAGAGVGVAGNARDDIWAGQLVQLRDLTPGAPSSRLWKLDDVAPGSAVAALANNTTAISSFTPDIGGTYKFTFERDGLKHTFILRVQNDNAGAAIPNLLPLPAFLERAAHSNGIVGQGVAPGRGWAPLVDSVRAFLLGGVGVQLLAYQASLTINMRNGPTVRVTALTGGITIANPTNAIDGQELSIETVQDGTGNRAITWGSQFAATLVDGLGYNDRRPGIRTIHRFKRNATLDQWVLLERVLDPTSGGVVEHSAGPALLVPGLINVLRATANTATVPAKSTGWGGSRNTITVKNDNLSAPPAVLSPSGGDTLNGGATFNVNNAYGQAVIFFEDVALTSNTILCSPG